LLEKTSLHDKPCIIITRPREDSEKTAKLLAAHGFDFFIEPAFRAENISDGISKLRSDRSKYDGVIITSKNALRIVADIDQNVKIIALGRATTVLAKDYGFKNVEYAGKNINELCACIKSKCQGKNFCYASGESITKELDVNNCGNSVTRIIVYKTIVSQKFSEEFIVRLKNGDFKGVMFFSTKTAEIFCNILEIEGLKKYINKVVAFCLSNNIAKSIKSYGFEATVFTKNANIDEIIGLIERFRFE